MRVFLLMAALLWGSVAMAQTAQVVEASGVNMRSGKAENYRIIKVLPPNSEVKVLETDTDYTRVKTESGETGWVLSKLLIVQKAAEEKPDHQSALESVQKELVASKVEVANLQRELEGLNRADPANAPARSFPFVLLVALGAFALGVAVGILILKAYYQKRLHGLRI